MSGRMVRLSMNGESDRVLRENRPWLKPAEGRAGAGSNNRRQVFTLGHHLEPIIVHDLGPSSDEITHELFFRVILRVDLAQGTQLRI
jgi:hypothetical protein